MKPALTCVLLLLLLIGSVCSSRADAETLPPLDSDHSPLNLDEMWRGFDPTSEPLETETIKEWEEDDVVLRIVRFRVGEFKGTTARLAGIFGFPKSALGGTQELPGLLQIHGGGQYADHKACLANAKRGYATLSIAWAGRISAPDYRVGPEEVKLFWKGERDNPRHKTTTDWGAVDGYHAPGRNPGNGFPSAKAADWTLDEIESPRNSGWFLCALAARRALTFLERQPEVDAERIGVYGHSMGGKLTVLTSIDPRVKAAAPSCGGISDRDNASEIFRNTLGDDVSLRQIRCPIIFLSPSNDFHGRIGDLPSAISEIQSDRWRVTCAPHHNHQDTSPYEVASLLWFDEHLKGTFAWPDTPQTKLQLDTGDGIPLFSVDPDDSMPIVSVDFYYTQQGKPNETQTDRENTVHRFWHHVSPILSDGRWTAQLPVFRADEPLWVFANVTYELDEPVSGAGYYYRIYEARNFNLSSLMNVATPTELKHAGIRATQNKESLIEDFQGDWQKEWFSYRPQEWSRSTNKLHDAVYRAPENASLVLQLRSEAKNKLVILVDDHAAEIQLDGGDEPQMLVLRPRDFVNFDEESLANWSGVRQLTLCPTTHLRAPRGSANQRRVVGENWKGPAPVFDKLYWQSDDAAQNETDS